jgi:hypothetical protein
MVQQSGKKRPLSKFEKYRPIRTFLCATFVSFPVFPGLDFPCREAFILGPNFCTEKAELLRHGVKIKPIKA